MNRYYFKCRDCLSVIVIESKFQPVDLLCSCESYTNFMGRVVKDRLVVDRVMVPCDGRCTNAIGPSCDCNCSGENHGTRRLVRFTIDKGKAPKASFYLGEKRKAIKREWLEAIEIFKLKQKQAKRTSYNARIAHQKATASKSHVTRMKRIKEAIDLLQKIIDRESI